MKPGQEGNGAGDLRSMAEELKRESERLRELAAKLEARERDLAEMEANYPTFKRFVYDKLREQFEKQRPELPDDVDLEAYAASEGGKPLEAFIGDIERIAGVTK